MLAILNITLPTLFVIVVGYIFGKLSKINITSVVDIALYAGAPALVFVSLLNQRIILLDAARVCTASIMIMFGCGIIAWPVFKILKQKHSGLYVSIAVMNTMNIPFPIMYLAYGSEGLIAATLFYLPNTLILSSLGIYILAGKHWRENIKEVLKLPIIYAAFLGLLLNFFSVEIPELAMRSLDLIARMAIPLVLIVLGYNLSRIRITSLPTTVLASFLRIGVGLLLGILVVNLLNITGVFRSVVILDSAMPAAAMASILATKYNNEAELVSSVVFFTTIASLVVIPLLLYMLA